MKDDVDYGNHQKIFEGSRISGVSLSDQNEMLRTTLIQLSRRKEFEVDELRWVYEQQLTRVKMELLQTQDELTKLFKTGLPATWSDCFYLGFKMLWRRLWHRNRKLASETQRSRPRLSDYETRPISRYNN